MSAEAFNYVEASVDPRLTLPEYRRVRALTCLLCGTTLTCPRCRKGWKN